MLGTFSARPWPLRRYWPSLWNQLSSASGSLGKDAFPRKSTWLVAIGSNLSALWILLANGWMQHPVGYIINDAKGRAELVNFFALIGNPKGWLFFWHTISDGLLMAAFMILAVSGYHLFRKQNIDFFKRSFAIASVVALIASVLVFLGGHTMGQYLYENQPMKFASIEAHWETSQPASFSILTIGDLTGKREVWSIRVPRVLSFLACNNFDCEVKGVNELQTEAVQQFGTGDYIPLMVITYWSFRIMMTFGFQMIAVSAYFVWASLLGPLTQP